MTGELERQWPRLSRRGMNPDPILTIEDHKSCIEQERARFEQEIRLLDSHQKASGPVVDPLHETAPPLEGHPPVIRPVGRTTSWTASSQAKQGEKCSLDESLDDQAKQGKKRSLDESLDEHVNKRAKRPRMSCARVVRQPGLPNEPDTLARIVKQPGLPIEPDTLAPVSV